MHALILGAILWLNGPSEGMSAPATGAWRGAPDPAEEQARLEIQRVLDAMGAAALAGDQAAYLANVWTGDAIFLQEQKNWAKDFEHHIPKSLSIHLSDADLELSDGWAAGTVEMEWAIKGQGPRTVSMTARFAATEDGWRYAGEDWDRVEGEGVLVLFDPGLEEIAQRVAEAFPEVREHVEAGFELRVDRAQQIKLYDTMEHLQASIYLSYTDGLSGWNEPGEAIKLVGEHLGRPSLKMLLAHEFGHVCTFEMGDQASHMPWWVLEGIAELSAERFIGRRSTDRVVRAWAAEGELVEWQKLADFRNTAPQHQGHVYKQGQHMVGFFSEKFGRASRNAWLRAMAKGAAIDEATKATAGIGFDELDAQWRASLEQPADAAPKEAGGL